MSPMVETITRMRVSEMCSGPASIRPVVSIGISCGVS